MATSPVTFITLQGKGGVGKTTITRAQILAAIRAGKKVLAVDADSQMHLTSILLTSLLSNEKGYEDNDFIRFVADRGFVSLAQATETLRQNPQLAPTLTFSAGKVRDFFRILHVMCVLIYIHLGNL